MGERGKSRRHPAGGVPPTIPKAAALLPTPRLSVAPRQWLRPWSDTFALARTIGARDVLAWVRNWPWQPIAAVAIVKVVLIAFALVTFHINQNQRIPNLHAFFDIWNRWDAPHYIDIAKYGYRDEGEMRNYISFYPLLPWLTRIGAWFTGDWVSGALLVSTVASFVAAVTLYYLVRLDEDDDTADRTVWFMLIFPTAYFLHVGYTESLFLAVTFGSFLAARRDRWFLAGLLAALACLTRANGGMLVGALGIEVLWALYRTRRWNWRWLWLGLGPIGFGIYLWINQRVYGDPFAFSQLVKDGWGKEFAAPWTGLKAMWDGLDWRTGADWQLVAVQEIVFTVGSLVLAVVAWFRCRPSYAAFMTANWLLFTSTSFVASVPRYVVILFPMYLLFAQAARSSRLIDRAITLWSLLFYSLFVTEYVQGRWAF